MNEARKLEIEEVCRSFGVENAYERLETAKQVISEFIPQVARRAGPQYKDEFWTKAVFDSLEDICPKGCGHAPRYWKPGAESRRGEYLVDFIWEESGQGKRVLMACESEWGACDYGLRARWGSVEQDFEKLLAVKAPFKLLVFSSNHEITNTECSAADDFSVECAINKLKRSLTGYWHHLAGETYIFIDFARTGVHGGPGTSEWFVWQARDFGRQEIDIVRGPRRELFRPALIAD